MTNDKPELDRRDVAVLLREASKRRKWYKTGEWSLMLAAAEEIERLRRWKAEALPVIAGLQELGKALGLPLGSRITGPEAVKRAEELAAKVAGVRAVCEDPRFEHKRPGDFDTYDQWHEGASDALGRVQQALD